MLLDCSFSLMLNASTTIDGTLYTVQYHTCTVYTQSSAGAALLLQTHSNTPRPPSQTLRKKIICSKFSEKHRRVQMIRPQPDETIKLTNGFCQTLAISGQGCTTNTHIYTLAHLRPCNEKCLDVALSSLLECVPDS